MSSFGEIKSAAGTQSKEEFVNALLATLPPIYEKEDTTTILYRLYEGLATELVKADIILESVAHNNYVSVPVIDELIIRSSYSLDRLQRENAYQLDRIRLNAPGTLITQNAALKQGTNTLQLYFIPETDIDFIISDVRDQTRTPLNFPTSFDSATNVLTITSDREGIFNVAYKDTGNVVRLNENITVPNGLFRLGYGDGGYNELGYGE
jgi:hypothetical protein